MRKVSILRSKPKIYQDTLIKEVLYDRYMFLSVISTGSLFPIYDVYCKNKKALPWTEELSLEKETVYC